jgi:nitrate/nitrite transport system ATP-binding protein
MTDVFLEARGVSKTFTTGRTVRPVLHDVTLSVKRGEFVSIVGSMGCGKSTFLSIAAGLTPPDQGTVCIDGAPIDGIRADAGFVFQNYSLLPWLSALENVRLAVGAAYPSWTKARQREQAADYLKMVGLESAVHRRPGQLSGGMRQRVAIARAFAVEPQILFLDEPFGALDALNRSVLQQELTRMCSASSHPVTTVMITNNIEEAILLSDRIAPMSPGPRATIGETIEVNLPRPRTPDSLMHDVEGVRVRAHVIEHLTAGFRKSEKTS